MEGYLDTVETVPGRQFEMAVKRLANSLSYGIDRSPFLGSGLEFAQSRPYQSGDPVRSIDWRVTARTGRFHVKEYEASKRIDCFLLIDTSASMTVGVARQCKYAVAVQLAGGLALACLDRASPVGVLAVGERALRIEPSMSTARVFQWLHQLRRFRYDERTVLGERVRQLLASLAHRSLVMVLSDLHDPAALPALRLLAQQHECIVLHLEDPAERSLRGSGFLRAREAETGRALVTHGRRRWTSPQVLGQTLARARVDYLRLEVDQPVVEKLRHFLRSRNVFGRQVR
ncbi:MAG TPA: DUF58 domain-containing protein [Pirellulales bacterium]|nr:DUF58 domain-containing protein [Pirellulales bacterium]